MVYFWFPGLGADLKVPKYAFNSIIMLWPFFVFIFPSFYIMKWKLGSWSISLWTFSEENISESWGKTSRYPGARHQSFCTKQTRARNTAQIQDKSWFTKSMRVWNLKHSLFFQVNFGIICHFKNIHLFRRTFCSEMSTTE